MSEQSHPLTEADAAAYIVSELARRGHTLAVAESLTGGLLVGELIGVPGASAVINGGVVAYNTAIKHSVLGVDAALLAQRGAVDPAVAQQMAEKVRTVCAVRGRDATFGLATTGVAGPESQDGKPPGTVYVALASPSGTEVELLMLNGDRAAVRGATVNSALSMLRAALSSDSQSGGGEISSRDPE